MNGHTATVERLVSLGANVMVRQKDGWTALHLAAKNGSVPFSLARPWTLGQCALCRFVFFKSMRLAHNKEFGFVTVMPLCRWDQTVERLIRLGINVNVKNDVDMTALHYAAVRFYATKKKALACMCMVTGKLFFEDPGRMFFFCDGSVVLRSNSAMKIWFSNYLVRSVGCYR
jgi:hypothetical protein